MKVPLPFLILGNPENRRVTHFQEALALERQPAARVVSWEAFLADPRALSKLADEPLLFRIDSPGENEAVERTFLKRGHAAARKLGCRTITPEELDSLVPSRGRIVCPRQAHLGFEQALDTLEDIIAAHPEWRCLAPPADIRELFDKRQTSRRYEAAGIPVPDALRDVGDVAALRKEMRARKWDSVFIKMSAGSSASCLGVFHRRGARESMHTTIEQASDGWFNTLRVRHVMHPERLAELLDFLFAEGSQIERAIPKARLDDAYFDLRVLCIAGEPRFVVVRQNRHPITNLHLGGWRGDLEALRAAVPEAEWSAAMQTCRRVAACYRMLHVGIDLMFEAGFEGHRIIEANAFGDLLPRLEVDGKSVWQWQIREALRLHS